MINGKTLRNTLLVIAALALAVFLIVSFGFFSASGHQSPGRIEDGVYYYSRFNCGLAYTPGEGSKLLSLPWKFGKEDAPAAYTVGERSFTLSEDETQLLENGTDVLPAGLSCSGSTSCWEIACGADGVPESLVYVGEV